jgi:hypothetical protein
MKPVDFHVQTLVLLLLRCGCLHYLDSSEFRVGV